MWFWENFAIFVGGFAREKMLEIGKYGSKKLLQLLLDLEKGKCLKLANVVPRDLL